MGIQDQTQEQQQEPQQPDNADLSAMFKGFSDAVMEQVENRLKSVTQPSTEASTSEQELTLKQRLALVEKQLADKVEAEARQARQSAYDNSVKSELSRYQLAYPTETIDIVKGLLAPSLDVVDGKWLSKDGKTLAEHIDAFFSTPFGQHLLKAPSGQVGTGTAPAQNPRVTPTPDANSAISRLFGLT